MGTYRPTYTKDATMEDPKLTDSIMDNALLTLLQNEEMMNHHRMNQHELLNRKLRPMGYRVNKKSPSTNYVGSLKASEPSGETRHTFKPTEWSLGPRCDRLTEEICLDDSDYPSSAIMSSIYKDKAKFDLMYAELKVRESQVEGLSRQQEQAYSFDHYFGQYPQGDRLLPGAQGLRAHRWVRLPLRGALRAASQGQEQEGGVESGGQCRRVHADAEDGEVPVTTAKIYSPDENKYRQIASVGKRIVDVVKGCCYHSLIWQSLQVRGEPDAVHVRPGVQLPPAAGLQQGPGAAHRPLQGAHLLHVPLAARSHPQVLRQRPTNGNNDKKNSFSSTLWAILGGGQQASALAQQPQFLDEVQKQISWTQQLKQFPQLMKQISPNQVLKQLLEEDEDDMTIHRQRIRQSTADRLNGGGFASHPVPISVPLPPPPPPPMIIARRPVVGSVTPDQNHMFGMPANAHAKVIAISPTESTKVFSLTKEGTPGKNVIRLTESRPQAIFGSSPPTTFHQVKAYKIRPGMYHSSSGTGRRFRPVLKPMPAPKGSNKRVVEDEDLIAVEKSGGHEIHAFKIETVTDEHGAEDQSTEYSSEDGKINFSYHPILEYLNL
ncbi:neurotrophin 1 [Caerostris extrusa]|uniref:Neurotrophin 1 n=1 Tax=Caerostris extrusa TaxID=172846 RepID=A0AAV4MLT0_CAEEX|nr:neurotrophin 1 [Caerostris extrusa]